MQHIQGISRQQLQVVTLEDTISSENPVRFIDAFVTNIDLGKLTPKPQNLASLKTELIKFYKMKF